MGSINEQCVRDFDKSNVQMHNCFRPGDIVKARVIAALGVGNARDGVMLSTAEDELGVIFAKSPFTGSMMVPRNWTEFECVQTQTKHKRKVAKPAN